MCIRDRPYEVLQTHEISVSELQTARQLSRLLDGFYNLSLIHIYVLPGGSHTTLIGSFDTDTQEEIKTQINAWLNKE